VLSFSTELLCRSRARRKKAADRMSLRPTMQLIGSVWIGWQEKIAEVSMCKALTEEPSPRCFLNNVPVRVENRYTTKL
jgi:hypothetical protein